MAFILIFYAVKKAKCNFIRSDPDLLGSKHWISSRNGSGSTPQCIRNSA